MQSILSQCATLDEEFVILVPIIETMIEELSVVSREFVSSKLEFLKKYSTSLKSSQIDARIHRNQQIRNLIEYVKMHRQSKTKSVSQIYTTSKKRQKFHTDSGCYPVQKCYSISCSTLQTTEFNAISPQQKNKYITTKILKQLITKQKKHQQKASEQIFRLISKCMNLISENPHQFPQYSILLEEYKAIKKNNSCLEQKLNLEEKSQQVKDNIKKLIQSQESFKSYLNSII
ncbi:unnamed protein product [Paramecium pentaurelia]|uniref:Uncharacterized protein n=1 Tax=Paramecium pentaurelia TaxID=43138 RepID=A0A8S1S847_9CILI|nr:unnamed protein product [Paramecium pentaurelia]